MAGLVFCYTKDLKVVDGFYQQQLGATLWLDQGTCRIYHKDGFMFAFCEHPGSPPDNHMLTFFYPEHAAVDREYQRLSKLAIAPPQYNQRYDVYHFFIKDPDGRVVEFQKFEKQPAWPPETAF
jgi:hypothetical protein